MGLLAPLFLAGLAALSVPLILHLVRRTPKGKKEFSSLMFLSPSPPRLTRRSRLDQILLLLMRLGALALLAFAFARPFLRQEATLALANLPSRRVAILLDTSASMRRADLWQQAIRQVEKELDDLGPQDEVAFYTFSDRLQTHVGFDTSPTRERGSTTEGRNATEGVPYSAELGASRVALVRQQLKTLRPTWSATDLGSAMVAAASELEAAGDVRQSPAAEAQLIVVSDFQKGARTEALQSFEWPGKVRLIAREIRPKQTTNAYAHLLATDEENAEELRLRVVNSEGSAGDQFFVHWAGDKPQGQPREIAVYVPPGQSRVVKLPRPAELLLADRVVLRGDDHEFDNTHYVVPPRKQEAQLVYVGSDAADDALGMQYYLRLATGGDPLRQVDFKTINGDDAAVLRATPPPQLAVVTRAVSAALTTELKAYAERGGMILLAPRDQAASAAIPALLDDVEVISAAGNATEGRNATEGVPYSADETKQDQFLLLGEIDFTHPLFAPFAGPRYSDFTKIHFWRQRKLKLKPEATTHVVARFDDGTPAILERPLGKGRVLVLASGWNPDDSQLALSSKFVPLVGGILDLACGSTQTMASVTVDQPLALPAAQRSAAVVSKPDGKTSRLAAGAEFSQTDEPGIYQANFAAEEARFAVNLAAAESNTAPLEMEQLEQLGVRLTASLTRAERLNQMRQQHDTELESRQKLWQWLIAGVLCVLVAETWWAGRAARQIVQAESAATAI